MRTAQKLIVENDGVADTIDLAASVSRGEVIGEIRRHLDALPDRRDADHGETVISKDLTIDSLAVMDMVMELEDRFDVSIPMNVVAEIHTVDELADTILKLAARR